jgi:hypothetical protein
LSQAAQPPQLRGPLADRNVRHPGPPLLRFTYTLRRVGSRTNKVLVSSPWSGGSTVNLMAESTDLTLRHGRRPSDPPER